MKRFLTYAAAAAFVGLMVEGLEQFDKRTALAFAGVIVLGVLLMNTGPLTELAAPFTSKPKADERPTYFGDLTVR